MAVWQRRRFKGPVGPRSRPPTNSQPSGTGGRIPRSWIALVLLGLALVSVRQLGWLESWELTAYDALVRSRPPQPPETRIVIVGVKETDIQALGSWPIDDGTMAQLLRRIAVAQPAAIGLDFYRDVPIKGGADQLEAAFREIPALVAIRRMGDEFSEGVLPPPVLDTERGAGFNNIVLDRDGRVRRHLLYWWAEDPRTGDRRRFSSLSVLLAQRYLDPLGLELRSRSATDPFALRWGRAAIDPLPPGAGSYVKTRTEAGYQILADFRGPAGTIAEVSLWETLQGRVAPETFRGKVVLVGATTESLKDYTYTAYSALTDRDRADATPDPVYGVELQAQFVSQLLDLALGARSPLWTLPDWLETVGILAFTLGGGALCAWRPLSWLALGGLVAGAGAIAAIAYGLLVWTGGWIPLVPPLLAWGSSGLLITVQVARRQQELARSKEFLNQIIDTIPDPIFVKDRDRRWIVLNRAFCEFIGYPLEALIDRRAEDVLPPALAAAIATQDLRTFATGEIQESESCLPNPHGGSGSGNGGQGDRIFLTKRSLHRDRAGNLFLVGVLRDITDQRHMEEELKRTAAELRSHNEQLRISEDFLRYQATHDLLTGLPNRQLLQERLTQALTWADDNHLYGAVMFLDLDGFKAVNDTYGHHAGDLLLKEVAQRLSADLRSSDTVARLGGDEFAILLPAIPRHQVADRVARKVVDAVSRPYQIEGQTMAVTTSIGIAFFPDDGTDPKQLLERADMAMFQAKRQGRNRFLSYGCLGSMPDDQGMTAAPTTARPSEGRSSGAGATSAAAVPSPKDPSRNGADGDRAAP
jgi:diguanylate cyclase (GGDEF)-like protein/PAS domain S-box-containing protein